MARCLVVVKSTYYIPGLAIVAFPGYVPDPDEKVAIADQVVIKRPDGSELEWTISGIELTYPPGGYKEPRPDLLLAFTDLDREGLPVGSEIWTR